MGLPRIKVGAFVTVNGECKCNEETIRGGGPFLQTHVPYDGWHSHQLLWIASMLLLQQHRIDDNHIERKLAVYIEQGV